jgi:Protein of unknown function (DUF4058)
VTVIFMTLRDHFRSPLSDRRHWHSFHNAWATYLTNENTQHWQPSPPTQVVPFASAMMEQVEVGIFSSEQSTKLIGAIEIVSPANKDRPSQREVFVTKCQSYLEQGVGLIVIDVGSKTATVIPSISHRPTIEPVKHNEFNASAHTCKKKRSPIKTIALLEHSIRIAH